MKLINIKRLAVCFPLMVLGMLTMSLNIFAQESPQEEDYFNILRVPVPEDVLLEVGGMVVLPNGDLGVSTRRGDIYVIENPSSNQPFFRLFASGLHEILGLAYKDGSFYCSQRGELTRLEDTDMDGKADVYETVYAWPLSGHYHEYSYGPKIAPDGSFFVSANVAFGDEQWWSGESRVPWRGWIMKVTEEGELVPWAAGVRSPAGLGMIDGELFYTDNQGDWVGSGGVWHVEEGDWLGHPASLRWTSRPNSPVEISTDEVYAMVDPRVEKDENGRYIKPENVQNKDFVTLYELQDEFSELKLPAVWLPHGILGISNSEIVEIPDNHFGPFEGQLLVGDQGQSKISRVVLEKVNGEYQGVAFDFRGGFQSGVLRMAWGQDKSLFVGETNRGWGSAGTADEGLQRLVWNKRVPFEMKTVKAMPDGFEIEFTLPVDRKSAEDIASYDVYSYIYKYHPVYGSPPVRNENAVVKGVKVSEDGMKARIIVEGLQRYHVHTIRLSGVREKEHFYSLVHPTAYYTLNNIPEGPKLQLSEVSTYNSASQQTSATLPNRKEAPKNLTSPDGPGNGVANATASTEKAAAPTFAEIEPLLTSNTCTACHNADSRQVGPSFKEIAKRKYSDEEIVELIYVPQPENWPDYATEMPPMPQVPEDEALKIADWINSLDGE